MRFWAIIGHVNGIQFVADMAHLASLVLLSNKIALSRTCKGISLKTVELYAIVFIFRYLNLFTIFISWYNTLMKLLFITITLTVIYQMRFRPSVRETYDKEKDSFRSEVLVLASAALACVSRASNGNLGWNSQSPLVTMMQVMFTMSLYLEAVAIIPQLTLLIKTEDIDTLTGNYVFLLGLYRGLYIIDWIHKWAKAGNPLSREVMVHENWRSVGSSLLGVFTTGVVQTLFYAEFFYYYVKSWRQNKKLEVHTLCAMREEQLCELSTFSCVGTASSPPAETGLRQRLLNNAQADLSQSELEAVDAAHPTPHASPQLSLEFPRLQKALDTAPADAASSPRAQHMHDSHVQMEATVPVQQLQVVQVKQSHSRPATGLGAASLDATVEEISVQSSTTTRESDSPCEVRSADERGNSSSSESPSRKPGHFDLY